MGLYDRARKKTGGGRSLLKQAKSFRSVKSAVSAEEKPRKGVSSGRKSLLSRAKSMLETGRGKPGKPFLPKKRSFLESAKEMRKSAKKSSLSSLIKKADALPHEPLFDEPHIQESTPEETPSGHQKKKTLSEKLKDIARQKGSPDTEEDNLPTDISKPEISDNAAEASPQTFSDGGSIGDFPPPSDVPSSIPETMEDMRERPPMQADEMQFPSGITSSPEIFPEKTGDVISPLQADGSHPSPLSEGVSPATPPQEGFASPPGSYAPPQSPAPPPGSYAPPQGTAPPPGSYAPPQSPAPQPAGFAPPESPAPQPGSYAPPESPAPQPASYAPPQGTPSFPPGSYAPPQGTAPPAGFAPLENPPSPAGFAAPESPAPPPTGYAPPQGSAPTAEFVPPQSPAPQPGSYTPPQGTPSFPPGSYAPPQGPAPPPASYAPLENPPSPRGFVPPESPAPPPTGYAPPQGSAPTAEFVPPQSPAPQPAGFAPPQSPAPQPASYTPLQSPAPPPTGYAPLQSPAPQPAGFAPPQSPAPQPASYAPLQSPAPPPAGFAPPQPSIAEGSFSNEPLPEERSTSPSPDVPPSTEGVSPQPDMQPPISDEKKDAQSAPRKKLRPLPDKKKKAISPDNLPPLEQEEESRPRPLPAKEYDKMDDERDEHYLRDKGRKPKKDYKGNPYISYRAHEIIDEFSPYSHQYPNLLNAERFAAENEPETAMDIYQRVMNRIPNQKIKSKIRENIQDLSNYMESGQAPYGPPQRPLGEATFTEFTGKIEKGLFDIKEAIVQGLPAGAPSTAGGTPASMAPPAAAPSPPGPMTAPAISPPVPMAGAPQFIPMPMQTPQMAAPPGPMPYYPPYPPPPSGMPQEIKGVLELKPPDPEDQPFLTLTYDFARIPHKHPLAKNHSILEYAYYKYKPMLVKASRFIHRKQITRALNYYRVIKDQQIPDELRMMIDKNISDITDYMQKFLTYEGENAARA